MRSISKWFLAAAVAIALIPAGCGGGGDNGGSQAQTKPQYLARVNAACKRSINEINAALSNVKSRAQAMAVIRGTLIPSIERATAAGRTGIPVGDDAEVNGIFDDQQRVIDQIKVDPGSFLASVTSNRNPFADTNRRLVAYGLKECGSDRDTGRG
jgi:hypothetical protein